jgi:hypothetical protein
MSLSDFSMDASERVHSLLEERDEDSALRRLCDRMLLRCYRWPVRHIQQTVIERSNTSVTRFLISDGERIWNSDRDALERVSEGGMKIWTVSPSHFGHELGSESATLTSVDVQYTQALPHAPDARPGGSRIWRIRRQPATSCGPEHPLTAGR